MPDKIPARSLYKTLEQMLADKWGYIWGTAGRLWTAELQANPPDEMSKKYGNKWIGHMVADCSGVMVYIWRQHGLTIPHGSNSIARKSVGKMINRPKPGYAAFKWRPTDTDKFPDGKGDYYHIGIVGADGRTVYESKSTVMGFVARSATEWDCFAPFTQVDYNEGDEDMPQTEVQYQAEVTTESGKLRLRSGPGTSYPIITSMPKGSIVDVLVEYDTGWDCVRYADYTGYASAQYLTPINDVTPAPEPKTPWAVIIPCETQEEAEKLASYFNAAIVAEGEDT